ncbi:MAG: HAD family hydrolase [Candidatus Rokuibacteriota bacterium]
MTAARPSVVLLDFGGVLWNMRWDVARALESAHGLPPGALTTSLYGSGAWQAVERGRGDRDAWLAAAHAEIERLAGRPLPPLHAEWRASQHAIPETIELVRALRPPYRVGVVSNADLTLRARLSDGLGILGLFDDIVCSAEVGCVKPEAEIYALACRRLGTPASACVFVDDYAANVAAAEAAGMRGILYRVDRGDDLRAQLASVGVVARPPSGKD